MESQHDTPTIEPISNVPASEATKKTVLTLPAAVLTGFALIALAIILVVPGANKATPSEIPAAQQAPETPTSVDKEVVTLRANDLVKGDAATAEILLFTYSDSDCPFCARFHPTVQSVLTNYKGKVAWVYRQFPLDMHPNAYTEAVAMECVAKLGGNTKAFTYLDSIINTTLTPDPKSNETLITIAKNEGIDGAAFKSCFSNESIAQKVDKDIADAGTIGARGTPFSIAVNKKTGEQVVIPGAYPLEAMNEMIDSIL